MKLIFSFLAVVFAIYAQGQNAWVRKLTYIYPMGVYWDSLTGVKHIEVGPDGSVYVLAHTDADNSQFIYKFAPNSNQVEWSVFAGNDGSSVDSWTDVFHVTKDSGIIFCLNDFDATYQNGFIYKYTKGGVLDWAGFHPAINPSPDYTTIRDVIERRSGGYYMLALDSLFTLDVTGGIVDTIQLFGGLSIREFPNGDFLFSDGNNLTRYDTALNILWTKPCSGPFDFDSTSVFIKHGASNIQKVDAVTGNQIWNIISPFSLISDLHATNEGGFLACTGYEPTGEPFWPFTANVVPGHLFKVDSLGDTLWTRTYNLPRYGLYSFAILPNGNIMTGGCYLSGSTPDDQKDFSAFVCEMNNDGSYPLAQTSYISGGDANNDHYMNFVDDALQTMLALTHTGPPRDSSVDGHSEPGYTACERSNIAIDWPTSSAGINDKYSDHNGDGVVDTNDVLIYNGSPMCYDSIPLFYRKGLTNTSQNVEEICFKPVRDTISIGELPEYNIIMGSNSNPVDSIYGFAIAYFFDQNYINSENFYSTDFGTPGTDLFKLHTISYITMNQYERYHLLLCRNDFQNALNIFDTLATIRFNVNNYTPVINLAITDFKAVLADGTVIPFNVCAEPIYVDTSSTSIHENALNKIQVFPNPANNELRIKSSAPIAIGIKTETVAAISIFNLLGEEIKSIQNFNPDQSISVSDLPDGFYTLTITTDATLSNSSFIIRH
jgi:hypothetical protein